MSTMSSEEKKIPDSKHSGSEQRATTQERVPTHKILSGNDPFFNVLREGMPFRLGL